MVASEQGAATRVVSDPDGLFLLEGLPPESQWISCQYPGLVIDERKVVPGRGDLVRIQMRRGSLMAGVVEGAGGRGAGSCWVWAHPVVRGQPAGQSDDRAEGPPERSVCAAAGAFELRGLRPGAYDLFATTLDGRSGSLPVIQLGEGEERRGLRLRVGDGLTLIGSVVDLESRRPIAGVRVRAVLELKSVEGLADAAGRFRIDGVPRGVEVDLQVEAPGYMPNTQTRRPPAQGDTLDFGVLPLLVERTGPPATGRAGIVLGVERDGRLAVRGTVDDLPAAKAGIAQGDVVVGIDGRDLTNANLSMAIALIRGASGTALTLHLRGPDNRVRTVRIVRA